MSLRRKAMVVSLVVLALFFLFLDGAHLNRGRWVPFWHQVTGQQAVDTAYAQKVLPLVLTGRFDALRPYLAPDLSPDAVRYYHTKLRLITAGGPVAEISALHLLRYEVNSENQWNAVYVLYVRHKGSPQADRLSLVVASMDQKGGRGVRPVLVGLNYNFADMNLLRLLGRSQVHARPVPPGHAAPSGQAYEVKHV